jgi:hypothetical protein
MDSRRLSRSATDAVSRLLIAEHGYDYRDDLRGGEQPHAELADEPEPDHADPLTRLRVCPAKSVQRDRSDGRVGGRLERHTLGNRCRERLGDGDHLRVVGEPASSAGNARPGCDPSTPSPTSRTTPAEEWPIAESSSSRSRAAAMAAPTPSTRARSTALRSRSGRARGVLDKALSAQLNFAALALGAGADQ